MGFLGPRFTAIRISLSLPFCLNVGDLAHTIESLHL